MDRVPEEPSEGQRVKVYGLDAKEDQAWKDKGTGFLSISFSKSLNALAFIVRSEDDPKNVLLQSPIYMADVYEKQGDSLITWSDPDDDFSHALSFQIEDECMEVWRMLCEIRHGVPEFEESEPFVLPQPTMENMEEVWKVIEDVGPLEKESFCVGFMRNEYLDALMTVFDEAEKENNETVLVLLFRIFRKLILLNDLMLVECLLSTENLLKIMGPLQYDPDLPIAKRVHHRNFLTQQAHLKEVVPFTNDELREKIHLTYRIQYLKDIVLPKSLDDGSFSTIGSLVMFNQMDIIRSILEDKVYISNIFRTIREEDIAQDVQADILGLLHELCRFSRNLQPSSRDELYQLMITQHGLFDVLEHCLKKQQRKGQLLVCEIIGSTLGFDASLLRDHLMTPPQRVGGLFHALAALMVSSQADLGVTTQIGAIFRFLLDKDATTLPSKAVKDEFFEHFYESIMPTIMGAVPRGKGISVGADTLNEVIELLSFCVRSHGFRIKYALSGSGIAQPIMKLCAQPHRFLQLSAVRFLRTCIGSKEPFFVRHTTQLRLLDPVMALFKANGPRYNLVNSAIIELIDFIRRENMVALVKHLVDNFSPILKSVTYVDTFRSLLVLSEENKAMTHSLASGGGGGRSMLKRDRRGERLQHALDEDAWFEQDEEEDDDDGGDDDDGTVGRRRSGGVRRSPSSEDESSNESLDSDSGSSGGRSPDPESLLADVRGLKKARTRESLPPLVLPSVAKKDTDDDDDDEAAFFGSPVGATSPTEPPGKAMGFSPRAGALAAAAGGVSQRNVPGRIRLVVNPHEEDAAAFGKPNGGGTATASSPQAQDPLSGGTSPRNCDAAAGVSRGDANACASPSSAAVTGNDDASDASAAHPSPTASASAWKATDGSATSGDAGEGRSDAQVTQATESQGAEGREDTSAGDGRSVAWHQTPPVSCDESAKHHSQSTTTVGPSHGS